MKILETTLRHGEVYFCLVDELPDLSGLNETERNGAGQYIVGHSESGNNHVVEGNAVRVVDQDEFVSYAEVREPAKVIQLKTGPDRHGDGVIGAGNYLIMRQREYTPEGFRRAAD